MSSKPDYYKVTEAKLYEYYTLDTSIPILRSKNSKLLEDKLQLKQEIESIWQKLSKEEQDFVQHVYGDPEANEQQLCNLFVVSQATFYRKKRNTIKKVALLLGEI